MTFRRHALTTRAAGSPDGVSSAVRHRENASSVARGGKKRELRAYGAEANSGLTASLVWLLT